MHVPRGVVELRSVIDACSAARPAYPGGTDPLREVGAHVVVAF
jgi:hypothetical protein